jgi:hypothetical protein
MSGNLHARKQRGLAAPAVVALVALGLALCLLLLTLHPAPGHAGVLAAVLLVPVVLFGLVAAPKSLWPAAGPDERLAAPVFCRGPLLPRPPPVDPR